MLYTGTDGALQVGDDTKYYYHIQLSNFQIRCSSDSVKYGLRLYGVSMCSFSDIAIVHETATNNATGVLLQSTTTGGRGVYTTRFYNCRIYSFKYALMLWKTGTARVNGNVFIACILQGLGITGGYGFYIGDGNQGDTNKMCETSFANFDTHIYIGSACYAHDFYGIRIEGGNDGIVCAGNDNLFMGGTISVPGTNITDTGTGNNFVYMHSY